MYNNIILGGELMSSE